MDRCDLCSLFCGLGNSHVVQVCSRKQLGVVVKGKLPELKLILVSGDILVTSHNPGSFSNNGMV